MKHSRPPDGGADPIHQRLARFSGVIGMRFVESGQDCAAPQANRQPAAAKEEGRVKGVHIHSPLRSYHEKERERTSEGTTEEGDQ
jgi:hypothetical protein